MNTILELSAQESRILHLMSKGLTNEGISFELGASVNTVKYHLKKIYRKLGAKNRVEAIVKFNAFTK